MVDTAGRVFYSLWVKHTTLQCETYNMMMPSLTFKIFSMSYSLKKQKRSLSTLQWRFTFEKLK